MPSDDMFPLLTRAHEYLDSIGLDKTKLESLRADFHGFWWRTYDPKHRTGSPTWKEWDEWKESQ